MQIARNSHAIQDFSRTPPGRSPPELRHLDGWTARREIETRLYIDRRERLGRVNPHVKIRSAACGSNNINKFSHEHEIPHFREKLARLSPSV